jgi:MFS family permease
MKVSQDNVGNKIFLIFCAIGAFAILSSTMSKNPVLNLFAKSLGTPDSLTGFVAAASTIPGILISLPAGSLSDILGRRKLLLISSFVFASAPFLYLLIGTWWQLILVRFYHGFATAIFVPVANATIAELFPEKKGERISTFSSSTIVGRSAAPFLGGYILVVTNNNFNTLYLAVGVAGVTALIVSIPFLFRKGTSSDNKYSKGTTSIMFKGWRAIASNHGVQIVSFMEATQYYTYGAIEYFLVGYLKDIAAMDSFSIGIINGGYLLIVLIFKPIVGRFSDRAGRRIPIIYGTIISGLPLLAIPFLKDFASILVLSIVYGLGFSMVTSTDPALASELVAKTQIGTSMGYISTIMDVGQTLGPIICGFIIGAGLGYVGLFTSLTVLLLSSCVIFTLSGVGRSRKIGNN